MKIKVVNPKNGLFKIIDARNYTIKETAKTCFFYMRAGYKAYIVEGIEKLVKL